MTTEDPIDLMAALKASIDRARASRRESGKAQTALGGDAMSPETPQDGTGATESDEQAQEYGWMFSGRIAAPVDRWAEATEQDVRARLADAEAKLARVESLFAGGPDSPCCTTWRATRFATVECVEVPTADLRAALTGERTTL